MVFHLVGHHVEVICQHGPYRFYRTWCLVKEVFGDGASPIQDFVKDLSSGSSFGQIQFCLCSGACMDSIHRTHIRV